MNTKEFHTHVRAELRRLGLEIKGNFPQATATTLTVFFDALLKDEKEKRTAEIVAPSPPPAPIKAAHVNGPEEPVPTSQPWRKTLGLPPTGEITQPDLQRALRESNGSPGVLLAYRFAKAELGFDDSPRAAS